MADLESIGHKSLAEMTTDEALEHLRQIRQNRIAPAKPRKQQSSRAKSKATVTKSAKSLTPEELVDLLTLLEE